jgi:hypothetical protein
MDIHHTHIAPGQHELVKIPAGRLPTGNAVQVQVEVFRSEKPGPTVLVLAGVHGDEVNGVEILRQARSQGLFERLQSGSVIAVPILNVYGFINFTREVPDGKDINRSFPGNSRGSLASRLARIISKKILPVVDVGVDLHTGAGMTYNYPQIRYSRGHAPSLAYAEQFGAPFLLAKPAIRKSLRRIALDAGTPILVFEGGENLRYDATSIAKGLAGLQRFLAAQGMLSEAPEPEPVRHLAKSSWMRAPRAGMFQWYKPSGHQVQADEPLGIIHDPLGNHQVVLYAPRSGYIVGHNNATVISQGDALFHIGYE